MSIASPLIAVVNATRLPPPGSPVAGITLHSAINTLIAPDSPPIIELVPYRLYRSSLIVFILVIKEEMSYDANRLNVAFAVLNPLTSVPVVTKLKNMLTGPYVFKAWGPTPWRS